MRLLYNPAALAYHYKHVTFLEACRRAEKVALARLILEQKEAGQFLKELEAKERETLRPAGLMHRSLEAVLRPLRGPLLAFFRLLVDSPIPLPWSVYRTLYREAASAQNHTDGPATTDRRSTSPATNAL